MRSIVAPARDRLCSARSNACTTASSASSSTSVVGTASRMPLTGRGCKASKGSPASTASMVAQQATLRANGPMLSSVDDSGTAPSSGTRRCVGLKPTMPL